jgi:hypothetical protein
MLSTEQIRQLIEQIEGSSTVLTDIVNTLPERPSRAKLTSQINPVLDVLKQAQTTLEAENNRTLETHTTRDSFFGNTTGMNLS